MIKEQACQLVRLWKHKEVTFLFKRIHQYYKRNHQWLKNDKKFISHKQINIVPKIINKIPIIVYNPIFYFFSMDSVIIVTDVFTQLTNADAIDRGA